MPTSPLKESGTAPQADEKGGFGSGAAGSGGTIPALPLGGVATVAAETERRGVLKNAGGGGAKGRSRSPVGGRVSAAVSGLEGGPAKAPRLLAPPGMEIPGGGGENFEVKLDSIMTAIQNLTVSVSGQLGSMGESLENLRAEVTTMKAEKVSNEIFQKLETRVTQLEEGVPATESAEIGRLRDQVARLDPANRALRVCK